MRQPGLNAIQPCLHAGSTKSLALKSSGRLKPPLHRTLRFQAYIWSASFKRLAAQFQIAGQAGVGVDARALNLFGKQAIGTA